MYRPSTGQRDRGPWGGHGAAGRWAGTQNGELLRRAQEQFDVFVTVDRNISFQQYLSQFSIAAIVLQAPTNRLKDLRPLMPKFN